MGLCHNLSKVKIFKIYFNKHLIMISPLKNPLPSGEYAASKVLISFYKDRWVPITFCRFVDAIALYRKAVQSGSEIFIFPPDCKLS